MNFQVVSVFFHSFGFKFWRPLIILRKSWKKFSFSEDVCKGDDYKMPVPNLRGQEESLHITPRWIGEVSQSAL